MTVVVCVLPAVTHGLSLAFLWIVGLFTYITIVDYLTPSRYGIDYRKTAFTGNNLMLGNVIGGVPLLWNTFSPVYLDLAAIPTCIIRLLICVVLHDVAFYLLHRLFHHRLLYSRFHKQHHHWVVPKPAIAFDASLSEHVFVNVLPVVLLGMALNMNLVETALWYGLATVGSVTGHVKGTPHALHHADAQCNFGTGLMLLDRLTGTHRER